MPEGGTPVGMGQPRASNCCRCCFEPRFWKGYDVIHAFHAPRTLGLPLWFVMYQKTIGCLHKSDVRAETMLRVGASLFLGRWPRSSLPNWCSATIQVRKP